MKHRALVEFQPTEIVLANGARVLVAGSMGSLHQPLEPGGNNLAEIFTFDLGKDAAPVAPSINTLITVNGKTFTIREVSGKTALQASWRVTATRTVIPSEA